MIYRQHKHASVTPGEGDRERRLGRRLRIADTDGETPHLRSPAGRARLLLERHRGTNPKRQARRVSCAYAVTYTLVSAGHISPQVAAGRFGLDAAVCSRVQVRERASPRRRQLGHSSVVLTVETYGEWSRSAQKAEAERLASAFPA